MIAVFEQEINDDGQMVKGTPQVMKLPLINYLMPTAYHWSRVYLEADMKVRQFNEVNGLNIQGKSTSFGAGVSASYRGVSGIGAAGNLGFSTSSTQVASTTSELTAEAVGSLHLEATLEPRADVQLPQPVIIQKGPRLKVSAGSQENITDPSDSTKAIGRKIRLTVELRDKSNNPIPDKQLEFRISQPLLSYVTLPANGKTGKVDPPNSRPTLALACF